MSNAIHRSIKVSLVLLSLSVSIVGAQRQAVVPQGQNASATLTPGIKYGGYCIRCV